MAKTPIGAIIELEGGAEYLRQLRLITQYTKEWKSETDKLTSSFDKNFKSMADVNKQRTAMGQELAALNQKLTYQKQYWEQLATTMKASPTREQQKAFSDLRTSINETETQMNELANAIEDLPADNLIGKIDLIKQNLSSSNNEWLKWGEVLTDVGKTMSLYVTTPIVAGFAAGTKMAMDMESQLTKVKKTNDEIYDSNGNLIYSYDMLDDALKKVGLTTGSNYDTIYETAELLGQFGLMTDQVAEATEYIIQLNDSTNLTAEDGASYLMTILNLINKGVPVTAEQFRKLGNVTVWLGNNFNTTEGDIAAMAARLAPAAAQINMTEADVMALATAMSEAKITAEGGGTAMTQVITNINKQMANFKNGAESNLGRIAELSGMTAEEFAYTWEHEPIRAIQAFVKGLGQLSEDGEYTSTVLEELDMDGIRQALTLNSLSLTYEHLDKAIEGANSQWENGTALTDEANKKYATADSQIQQLKNSLVLLGDSFGKLILPILQKVVDGLTKFFIKLSNLDPISKTIISVVAALLAAIGPVLLIGGKIATMVGTLIIVAGTLGVTVGTLLAPVIAITAGIAALVAGVIAVIEIIKNWDAIVEEFKARLEVFKIVIAEIGNKIAEFFTKLGEEIMARIEFDFMFLKEVGSQLLSWFASGAEKLISLAILKGVTLINNVKNLGSQIKSFFSNLISEAWNWGKDLIGNIISGITSKISSLVSAVSSVASKVRSYLHFSEPDVGPLSDFHTWMPDMMEGLAKGIEDNLYLVDRAIGDVASTLSGGTNVNYGGVIINLNVPQGANGQQILNEIETELANRTMRRRAVFG